MMLGRGTTTGRRTDEDDDDGDENNEDDEDDNGGKDDDDREEDNTVRGTSPASSFSLVPLNFAISRPLFCPYSLNSENCLYLEIVLQPQLSSP